MKWLNLLGLSLQFFAFWFAAPELLGAQTLARFEKGLISFLAKVPTLLIALVGTGAGIGMSLYGIRTGLNAAKGEASHIYLTMGGIIFISIFLVLYFTVFAKRTQK